MLRIAFGLLLAALAPTLAVAQGLPQTGEGLYKIGCAKCHGDDGRGVDLSTVGFNDPLPDFSDCAFATPEPDADWLAIVHEGGPVRGFAGTMPAFGEAFSVEQIQKIIDFIRGFCPDHAWPRGDLNLPRPFVTEKAFPENEAVWTTGVAGDGAGAVTNKLNAVYAEESAKLEPALAHAQLSRLADESW